MNKQFFVPLIGLALIAGIHAQGPNEGFVLETEAIQHQLFHPDAAYPPIAKAAHVQGSVLLHAAVDANGNVTEVEAIGGPPMLKAAAIEAVKLWTYQPFLKNGKPAAVQVVVSVPFSLGIPAVTEKSDSALSTAYFPKSDECRAASSAGKWSEAVKLCGALVIIADRFPDPVSRANEIRGAHQLFGIALTFSKDYPGALNQFHIAIGVAEKSLTPVDAEYASVYFSQAFAEHSARMTSEANRDYLIAEQSYRKAIASLPDMSKPYGHSLAQLLVYHALLVLQSGDATQANALTKEAAILDPNIFEEMKLAQ